MTASLVALRPEAAPRAWSIVLPRPPKYGRPLGPEEMTASELMFFHGAPLAHVVRYEEHLREQRAEKAARGLMRLPRSLSGAGQLARMTALPPLRESGSLAAHEG
jgi:hypothetical protein